MYVNVVYIYSISCLSWYTAMPEKGIAKKGYHYVMSYTRVVPAVKMLHLFKWCIDFSPQQDNTLK